METVILGTIMTVFVGYCCYGIIKAAWGKVDD